MTADSSLLLAVDGLTVSYGRRGSVGAVLANDAVTFDIRAGETLGLVGESGSGKSTVGDAILGFAPITSGSIVFQDEDITHARGARRRALSRHIQVVFQNPYGSLNPMKTVGGTLTEPLRAHGLGRLEADRRVGHWLDVVGLPRAATDRYPADFSGGQRQRIAIARALLLEPRLVICDEAVSALDLSIQAQILNLLLEIQEKTGVSYLFISHDIGVVEHMSDRVAVMQNGRILEQGPAQVVLRSPRDPYTRRLLEAVPRPASTTHSAPGLAW